MKKSTVLLITIFFVSLGGALFYVNMGESTDHGDLFIDEDPEESGEILTESDGDEDLSDNYEITMTQATLKTSEGDIVLEFYPELAPNTVLNFQRLAETGFYDGVIFHRVIEGFMIQGGDPTGTGTGGPGYSFDDEFDPSSEIAQRGYVRGTLAMANSGPNTNGSQFFIMHKDTPLPYEYTIFGRVVEGMDVVDAIATTETGAKDKPVADMVIEEVVISKD